MSNFDLSGYIDVAQRIAEFRAKYQYGSLQPMNLDRPFWVETIGEQTFIVVVAAAYREPEDVRPGVGMAYEPFPGKTPYTKGSELQNAETSAWGRAIVAVLAADTKTGVASADEVRNRTAEREAPDPCRALRGEIAEWVEHNDQDMSTVQARFTERYGMEPREASKDQLSEFLDSLRDEGIPEEAE